MLNLFKILTAGETVGRVRIIIILVIKKLPLLNLLLILRDEYPLLNINSKVIINFMRTTTTTKAKLNYQCMWNKKQSHIIILVAHSKET